MKMYPNLVSVASLALATLYCSLFLPIRALNASHSGKTIGNLIALDAGDLSYSADAEWNITARDTSTAKNINAPLVEFHHGKLISVSYNTSDGNGGYNISLPTDLCASGVVGDFETPSGRLMPNGTYGEVWDALADLSSAQLTKYTTTKALALQSKLNTFLSTAICPSPPDRELRANWDPDNLGDGFWLAFFFASLIGGGVGFAGLYTAIIGSDRHGYSSEREVYILASFAVSDFMITTILLRSAKYRFMRKFEAYLYYLFIVAMESFLACVNGIGACPENTWSGTCAAAGVVKLFVLRMLQKVTTTQMSTSQSSMNLVGQDLERGSRSSQQC